MKKSLAIFVLFCVLLSGGIAALSLVPHVHGDDFDHSEHQTCPIHQVSVHHFDAAIFAVGIVMGLLILFYLLRSEPTFFCRFSNRFISLRAPPPLI
jgi:hypothetical protein